MTSRTPAAMTPIQYLRPTSDAHALRALGVPGAHALGGGTDLLVTLRESLVSPEWLVDLRALPGADAIRRLPDGSLRLGAAVRIVTLAGDEGVRERYPALAMACEAVGSPALRNMGTLGGNLCQRPRCAYFRSGVACLKSGGTACPAVDGENRHLAILGGGPCHAVHPSDPAVALVALDATVQVMSAEGERTIATGDFFTPGDPLREHVLGPGEFVAAVTLPAAAAGGRQWFSKVLHRGAWDFALASVAVSRRPEGAVRLVLGGVAAAPWRVPASVEEDLAASGLSADDFDALAERALHDARPLAGNEYKVTLSRALLREAMARASSP